MTVDVRAATTGDALAIALVHVATWQAGYRGLLPGDYLDSLSVEVFERNWVRLLDGGARVLLHSRGSEVVGFVSYGPSRDEDASTEAGEVYAIYVHPSAWGTGAGRRLHDAALASLAAQGSAEATLWVLDGNERARAFYERQGWHADGTSKTEQMAGTTVTEIRYRRFLAAGREPR